MPPPPDATSVDPKALRDAFGTFMTGVTVVTTFGPDQAPLGFTANSFTSVSLDPPLLLVCLARTSRSFDAFTQASGFAVNILSETQKDISNTFAGSGATDRFSSIQWRKGPHGAPVLSGVAAWFDCSRDNVIDAGDHVILLGRIEAFEQSNANGLGFARGTYFTPQLAQEAVSVASAEAEIKAAAVATRDQEVLLFQDEQGHYGLPFFDLDHGEGPDSLGNQLEQLTGLPVAVGFAFAIFGTGNNRRIVYRCELGPGTCQHGRFFALGQVPLDQVVDPSTCAVLREFIAENALPVFGGQWRLT